MQKVKKHGTFALLYPRHVRGLGTWLKLTGILYLLGESSLAAESRCLSGAFRVPTLTSPPI